MSALSAVPAVQNRASLVPIASVALSDSIRTAKFGISIEFWDRRQQPRSQTDESLRVALGGLQARQTAKSAPNGKVREKVAQATATPLRGPFAVAFFAQWSP